MHFSQSTGAPSGASPARPPPRAPADDPNLLSNKPIASRAAVISAGVLANVAFAYLTLLLQVRARGGMRSHGRGLALRVRACTRDAHTVCITRTPPAWRTNTTHALDMAHNRAHARTRTQVGVVGKAETSYLPGVQIPSLAPTSLAATSGLRAGDVIVGVDAVRIGSEAGEVRSVRARLRPRRGCHCSALLSPGVRCMHVDVAPRAAV